MNIRAKITVSFFVIVIFILCAISFAIYFSSVTYRTSDFYRRLKNRAISTASLLIEIKEVSSELLKLINKENPANLPNQYIAIYNDKGNEIYNSEGKTIVPVNNLLENRIFTESEVRFEYFSYEVVGFVFESGKNRFIVIAAATDVFGFEALANLRKILFVVFFISIIFVSISGWIYAGRVLRPISKIVQEVDSITEVSLDLRLNEGNRSDEIERLSQTFNRMLERIQVSFLAQKKFISNASHELRTPLTIITAEVDAALLQHRTKEQYVEVLKSILESTRGLNALSTQLLLLAQTSAQFSDKSFAEVRIDEILWDAKQDLEKIHSEYFIDIHFDLSLNDEALIFQGDPQLLKAVFSNLIDNGCKYSNNNEVTIDLKLKDTFLHIEFLNNGRGIDANDLANIFAPFFRGKNIKSIKGYGIGLSLAQRIIELHCGSITVDSFPGAYTRFVVSFPLTKPNPR